MIYGQRKQRKDFCPCKHQLKLAVLKYSMNIRDGVHNMRKVNGKAHRRKILEKKYLKLQNTLQCATTKQMFRCGTFFCQCRI